MKKTPVQFATKLILSVLFLTFTPMTFAQPLEKGDIILDPYYGGPNFGKLLGAKAFPIVENEKVSGVGPLGIRGEYMLTDRMGLGLDYIYNNFSLNGTIDSLGADGSTYQTFPYKVTLARTRIQARFNYHFNQQGKVNAYIGLGAGANIRKVSVSTDMVSRKSYVGRGAIFPLTFRLAFGMRCYITRNIGLQAEMGLGGPLISGGLSVRI